jgi:dTDP-4-amino-4,6-dideoxygalactose transaminase
MIATADADLAGKARLLRNFGFAGYDQVVSLGINAKMSEVSAAMGLTNLESVRQFVKVNEDNYRVYRRELKGVEGVSLLEYDASEASNYQYVVLVVETDSARLSRDSLLELLWSENVLARRYFYPGCHRMAPYGSEGASDKNPLPVTEWIVERVLTLPTGTDVDRADILAICELIKFAVAHGDEISRHLKGRTASVDTLERHADHR